ncbi:hypothetical protein CPC08DRAFT_804044 [Agrocybe pediades]|nr:hypothetical protein CPC08DRAFT_804044 [Agrocybe pediades]
MPPSSSARLSLEALNISSKILTLAHEDRRILVALLKWSPNASQRVGAALDALASPWTRRCIEEDYLLILHDLEHGVQKTPIIWADIAHINIRLENLYACLQQVVPNFAAQGVPTRESAVGNPASFFQSAQQITIHGGSFTIFSQSTDAAAASAHRVTLAARTPSVLDVAPPAQQAPTISVAAEGTQRPREDTDGQNAPAVGDSGIKSVFGVVKRFVMGCF